MKTALLVEDNAEIAEMLELALKKSGFTVLRADNAGNALHFFFEHRPDIKMVICDYNLVKSELSAVDFIKTLSGLKFEGQMVAISGEDDNNQKLMDAGCTAQFRKPFDIQKFIEAINA